MAIPTWFRKSVGESGSGDLVKFYGQEGALTQAVLGWLKIVPEPSLEELCSGVSVLTKHKNTLHFFWDVKACLVTLQEQHVVEVWSEVLGDPFDLDSVIVTERARLVARPLAAG